jgi:nitrile hydratase beta subunit
VNGVHDLGGMHGFGPVELHDPALRFEYDWEPAVVAMQSAMEGRVTNIDEFRHAIERMDPVHYLGSTYFEHWVESILASCIEKGVFAEAEFAAREAGYRAGRPPPVRVAAAPWPREAGEGHPFRREPEAPPRFAPGDYVMTVNAHPAGHTRLARYARRKRGTVSEYRGCFVFPDTNAHRLGEHPQHLYSVRFEAPELWGATAESGVSVWVDLFESYLEPAGG